MQICRDTGWPNTGLKKRKQEIRSTLVRKQYKVLFKLLVIKDKRKNPNPKMPGISNNTRRRYLRY